MREITIELYDDKSVKVKDILLGDKFDSKITSVIFDFTNSEFADSLKYKYFYYKNINSEDYKVIDILKINNNRIVLDCEFTKNYGDYDCLLVLSNEEVIDCFENDSEIFVSNSFILSIRNNFLEDTKDLEIKENKEGL